MRFSNRTGRPIALPNLFFKPHLNIIGVFIAQTYKAPVPVERLIGKSPEYIVAYTSIYQSKRGEIQVRSASTGCVSGILVLGGMMLYFINEIDSGGGGSWCSPFL